MTDSEKIDFLAGQVQALAHFVVVLINTHHDRALLKEDFAIAKQVGLAKIEWLPVSDRYLDGMHEMNEQIARGIEIEQE